MIGVAVTAHESGLKFCTRMLVFAWSRGRVQFLLCLRQLTAIGLLIGLCLVLPAHAQQARDYFTADNDWQARRDLNLNNAHHTDQVLKWLREGNIPMALEDAKFTINKWPNHPRALILLEVIAKVSHAPTLPVPYYEKALKMYPQYAITHAQFGRYLIELGQIDAGIDKLRAALALDGNLTAAHAWLSDAYMNKGTRAMAKEEAEKARALGYRGELLFDNPSPRNDP